MGGNYQKGLYDQLMEVMARVDNLEFQHKEDHRVIDGLKNDVAHLENRNAILEDKATFLSEENASLKQKCEKLTAENELLRNDNESLLIKSQGEIEEILSADFGHNK